jgi:DNA-binding transcriptional regulator YhcF (GntR family)
MLGLVHHSGSCFASIETLARETGLSLDTVKKARRRLREAKFWTSHMDRGGKGYIACYRPNPEALQPNFVTSHAHSLAETVDATGPPDLQ